MKQTLTVILILFLGGKIMSQDISQWRGPNRDGTFRETKLLSVWPPEGPPLIWSASGIGKGYSSAVATENVVYVTGMKDTMDYITALNKKGEILWQTPFGPSWTGPFPEARCTPTVEKDFIYVVSGSGTIACVGAGDGKIRWAINGVKKFDGAYGDWGVCESLLLAGEKLIYTPAGPRTTMVALNKNTGETIWESESLNDTSAYVSPRLIRFGNKEMIVTLINKYFFGVDVTNGKILWKYDYAALKPELSLKIWPGAPKTNTITPLFMDGFLYITGGYDHPGAMFRLSDDATTLNMIWTETILDCHHGGVVLLGGYIYGSNWINNGLGKWCCIDWETGKVKYEQNWFTKGSVITAEGMLYCYEEKNGNVGLVKPDPQKFEVISSFKAPKGNGPCWAHPFIKDGILYLRHGDALMAYDIRKK